MLRSLLCVALLLVPQRCDEDEPDGGADGGAPVDDAGPPAPPCVGPPGLYVDDDCAELADGLYRYRPQYELWSDDADKERFVYLPPGTQIDTTNPDRWTFPQGTRLYKTFARGGVRLETRLLEKTGTGTGPANWRLVSYAWSADQRSVTLADAAGVQNVLGTTHDIPSQAQCVRCHQQGTTDISNGFQAIQLNHRGEGVTLRHLLRERVLVNAGGTEPNVTLGNARIPGSPDTRQALGYLHANCGNCHGGPAPSRGMALWSLVGVEEVEDTPVYTNAVCQCLTGWTGRISAAGEPITLRIDPSHPARSGVFARNSIRGGRDQMPPLGTEVVHTEGLAILTDWIESMGCCETEPTCPPPPTVP